MILKRGESGWHPKLEIDAAPINRFLSDTAAVDRLIEVRRQTDVGKRVIDPELQEYLAEIYLVVKPVGMRFLRQSMRKFILDSESIKDIRAEQELRTWKMLLKLNWERYIDCPQQAVGAMIKYLEKSTGSFFADEVWKSKRNVARNSKHPRGQINRPVEDGIIAQERPAIIRKAWKQWKGTTPAIHVEAVENRYIKQETFEKMAARDQVTESAIRHRLNEGKKAFYRCLNEGGINMGGVITSSLLVEYGSSMKQLTHRRELLLEKWPDRSGLFDQSPGMKQALVTCYGLEGDKPILDLRKTAEVLNISYDAVRVRVSQAVRIVLGVEPPSWGSIELKTERQLYDYWTVNQPAVQLSLVQEQVLRGYFGDGLTLRVIAERLEVSEATVGRSKQYALNAIQVSQSGKLGSR